MLQIKGAYYLRFRKKVYKFCKLNYRIFLFVLN